MNKSNSKPNKAWKFLLFAALPGLAVPKIEILSTKNLTNNGEIFEDSTSQGISWVDATLKIAYPEILSSPLCEI